MVIGNDMEINLSDTEDAAIMALFKVFLELARQTSEGRAARMIVAWDTARDGEDGYELVNPEHL